MGAAISPVPSSPEEWLAALDRSTSEAFALLDRLNQAAEARRAQARLTLDAAVARLSGGEGSVLPEPDVAGLSNGRPSFRDGSDGRPFVRLPQRTTHGGPWGPAVAAKLRDEALGRRRW